MKKPLRIGVSPLSNSIYAGTILKDGRTWGANKTDVTLDVLVATVQHAQNFGKPIILSTEEGTPTHKIKVFEPGDPGYEDGNAAVAAIQYALDKCDPDDACNFLGCWNEGEFDNMRRRWDNIPDEVFIGAEVGFVPTDKEEADEPI